MSIAIIILAAGGSTRMGRPKQLLPWNGNSLLEHAINTAKGTDATEILVVLGAEAKRISNQIGETGVVLLENERWQEGMGGSIGIGVRYCLRPGSQWDGILIMLCDQPLISTPYLTQMIGSLKAGEKGIIATAYGMDPGVPALFSPAYFNRLKNLEADSGARELLSQGKEDCLLLPSGVHTQDIDTEAQYQNLLKSTFKN